MIKTPLNPITVASQVCHFNFSPRKAHASTVRNSGIANEYEVASAKESSVSA
jgi:hypothetical protein